MKPSSTPGMNVSTLLIVAACEKSGPGMAARRSQASWRAKAVLMMRISKALSGVSVSSRPVEHNLLGGNEGGDKRLWFTSRPRK